jgi:peptidoglycan hydrolase-like protein with peptidoglycan-binding domain
VKGLLARRWLAVAAGLAVLAGGGAWLLLGRGAQAPALPMAGTTGLARVVRADLVTAQPVSGTVGYGAASTLVAPATSTPQALAQAQAAVTTAVNREAADRAAAGDGHTIDQLTLTADQQREQADCTASGTSAQCASDQQKVAMDQALQRQHADEAQATGTADEAALAQGQQQLSQLQAVAGSPGSFYTGLAGPGSVVTRGQALYWIDGRPVPLLYGDVPAYRVMRTGVSGPDVRQLEQDLIALGDASAANLTADGSFTSADAEAVRRWQSALGVAQTGVVDLGDAVFLAGAIRVTALHAAVGGAVQGGQPVLDYTATTRMVTVALSPSLSAQVQVGDAVTVDLPDGRTRLSGRVSTVSTVATLASQAAQTQNGAPQATIGVAVTFDDPSRVTALDQAPVTVDITTQSARGVLAVPVNALLALAGGGYGVEVVGADGRHRLVTVQTGIFDSSRVEVSGAGLSEGQSVVVPAS